MKYRMSIDPDGVVHVTVVSKQAGRRFVADALPTDSAYSKSEFRELLTERVGDAVLAVRTAQGRAGVQGSVN